MPKKSQERNGNLQARQKKSQKRKGNLQACQKKSQERKGTLQACQKKVSGTEGQSSGVPKKGGGTEGHAFTRAINRQAAGPTALPKAGSEAEGEATESTAFAFAVVFLSPFSAQKSHVKPPNP
jgi:hypothetical protein